MTPFSVGGYTVLRQKIAEELKNSAFAIADDFVSNKCWVVTDHTFDILQDEMNGIEAFGEPVAYYPE